MKQKGKTYQLNKQQNLALERKLQTQTNELIGREI